MMLTNVPVWPEIFFSFYFLMISIYEMEMPSIPNESFEFRKK